MFTLLSLLLPHLYSLTTYFAYILMSIDKPNGICTALVEWNGSQCAL